MTEIDVGDNATPYYSVDDFTSLNNWGRAGVAQAMRTSQSWRLIRANDQSGLRYMWQDSGPALPSLTATRRANLVLKRALDVLGAGIILVTLTPLLLLCCLIIKVTSQGPVLFTQERMGYGNKPFRILKFRSMYTEYCDHSGVQQTVSGDSRVTPFGRFLRKSNIDELPQLFNVLKGDMSLVGPRPHVSGQIAGGLPYQDLVPYYSLRHVMRPGLTGWAQCNGLRGPTDNPVLARARVDHDLAYIQNFSVWLDIKTMFLTVWREVRKSSGF